MTRTSPRDILGVMTEPPNSQDLAKRFLDLWQDQVTRMSTDPDMADGMRRWQAFWLGMGQPGAQDAAGAPSDGLQPGYGPGTSPVPASPEDTTASQDTARAAYDGGRELEADGRTTGGDGGRGSRLTASGAAPSGQTGATPAAVVSGDGSDDLAVILRELRRLEGRIASLERRIEDGGGEQGKRGGAQDRGVESPARRAGSGAPKSGGRGK